MALDKMTADSVEKAGQIAALREELRVSREKVEECEGVIRDNESTRRRLHNTILELKGTSMFVCSGNEVMFGSDGRRVCTGNHARSVSSLTGPLSTCPPFC